MDFDLDDDERALESAIRDLCAGRCSPAVVRAAAASGGVDRGLFAELAATGVLSLHLPEADGGLGLGATHRAVVFTELGRALVPGPVVATHLAAGLVDGAADGTTVVAAVERGRRVVPHVDAVDALLVVDGAGLWRLDPSDVVAVPVARPLDPVTPVSEVAVLPQGEQVGDAEAAQAFRRGRTLLTASQLLGTALASTELATAYAREREQFGRAIGSFQAVKHLLADALTRAEVARAAVYAAACHLDDPGLGDIDVALAGAALLAAEAAKANAKTGIQVHGGMGFTWEVDAHLHLKRTIAWTAELGATAGHAERIAVTL